MLKKLAGILFLGLFLGALVPLLGGICEIENLMGRLLEIGKYVVFLAVIIATLSLMFGGEEDEQ